MHFLETNSDALRDILEGKKDPVGKPIDFFNSNNKSYQSKFYLSLSTAVKEMKKDENANQVEIKMLEHVMDLMSYLNLNDSEWKKLYSASSEKVTLELVMQELLEVLKDETHNSDYDKSMKNFLTKPDDYKKRLEERISENETMQDFRNDLIQLGPEESKTKNELRPLMKFLLDEFYYGEPSEILSCDDRIFAGFTVPYTGFNDFFPNSTNFENAQWIKEAVSLAVIDLLDEKGNLKNDVRELLIYMGYPDTSIDSIKSETFIVSYILDMGLQITDETMWKELAELISKAIPGFLVNKRYDDLVSIVSKKGDANLKNILQKVSELYNPIKDKVDEISRDLKHQLLKILELTNSLIDSPDQVKFIELIQLMALFKEKKQRSKHNGRIK